MSVQQISGDRTSAGITGVSDTDLISGIMCFRESPWSGSILRLRRCLQNRELRHAGTECPDAIHGILCISECWSRKRKRAKQSMFTGIGVGLAVGCVVFVLVMLRGDLLTGLFTTDAAVVQRGYEYLKGFALETIVTAVLFSMIGYFNGNNKTVWVMTQGLIQTLLVRLPFAYFMSIQPDASLTMIGLAAPVSTMVGIMLNICFYIYLNKISVKNAR